MAQKSSQKSKKKKTVLQDKPVDLRHMTWWEIHQELQSQSSQFDKAELFRQLAENFCNGRYRNVEKLEVEIYLRGFLNGQAQTNLTTIFGCGFKDEAALKTATRQIPLTIYAFLSRSKVNGATQGIIDAIANKPPDGSFLQDANAVFG